MQKKGLLTIILLAAITTMVLPGVLGFTLNFGQGMNQIVGWISDLFGAFFAALLGGGAYLFERVLLLVIVLAFTKAVLSNVPVFKDKKGATWLIAIITAILAGRFGFKSEFLQTIFLPYTVLGIAITSIVPFIIYFFFVNSFEDNKILRKILWIFYAVLFFILWVTRMDQLGTLSWVYFWTAIAALVIMFLDGTIRRMRMKAEYEEMDSQGRAKELMDVRKELSDLETNYTRPGVVDEKYYHKRKKMLRERIDTLIKRG